MSESTSGGGVSPAPTPNVNAQPPSQDAPTTGGADAGKASAPGAQASPKPIVPAKGPDGRFVPQGGEKASEGKKGTGAPAEPVPVAAPPKTYKVKVDGQDMDVTEDELVKNYAHRRAADQRMKEATNILKQNEAFFAKLRADPLGVLRNPNLKLTKPLREAAEEFLLQQLEEDGMDPRDRELRDLKAERDARGREAEEAKKRDDDTAQTKLREQYQESFSKEIVETLEQAKLPKNEVTVKRMAFYMSQAVKDGLYGKTVFAKDIASMVREDFMSEQKALMGELDAETLLSMYPDVAEKLRKHAVGKHEAERRRPVQRAAAPAPPVVREDKRMTKDEWRERIDRMKQGLE